MKPFLTKSLHPSSLGFLWYLVPSLPYKYHELGMESLLLSGLSLQERQVWFIVESPSPRKPWIRNRDLTLELPFMYSTTSLTCGGSVYLGPFIQQKLSLFSNWLPPRHQPTGLGTTFPTTYHLQLFFNSHLLVPEGKWSLDYSGHTKVVHIKLPEGRDFSLFILSVFPAPRTILNTQQALSRCLVNE